MTRRPLVPAVFTLTLGAWLMLPSEPVRAARPTVHVTAAGDYAALSSTSKVLNAIKAAAPEAHFALGDLSYGSAGGEQAWCDFVTARLGTDLPFELLAGNHESNGVNGNIDDFADCLPNRMPGLVGTYARQYYVDHPQSEPTVRFVMISPGLTFPDGVWSYAAGSARYRWTADAIDGARAAGIPWVVVGMHLPCLTVGSHRCESGIAITDLLLQKKVDLVLAGHEHSYARTKQLGLSTGCSRLVVDAYDADCVVDGDDQLTKDAGTVFVTVGTGGVGVRAADLDDAEVPYFAALMGEGATTPSYGFLDIVADADELTGRFVPATASYRDAFTITRPAATNRPPVAVVPAPSCSALTCTFSAAGTSDPDGVIAGYSWTFGDGDTSSSAAPTHTYAGAGTYPVTLAVTDDDGATSTASNSVTVAPSSIPFALDSFARTVTKGWGSAEAGGAWTVGPVAQGAVSGGVGLLRLSVAGDGPGAYLPGVTSSRTDLTATVSVDKPATGSGTYVWLRGRRVPGAGDYRAKLWWQPGNVVRLSLARTDSASTETPIGSSVAVPGGVTVGERLRVRLQVTGTFPTTVRAKLWRLGQAEPAAWTVSTTDTSSGLQAAGQVGITTYLSASATAAPVVVSVDDWRAATP